MPAVLPVVDAESDVLLRDGTTLRLRIGSRADAAGGAGALRAAVRAQSLLPLHDGAAPRPCAGAAAARPGRPIAGAARRRARRSALRHRRLLPRRGGRSARRWPSRSPTRCRGAASARACSSGSPRSRRERGIRAFDAYVLGENLAMMDVFLQSGFTLTQGLDQGVFHVVLQLEPTRAFGDRVAAARSQLAAAASMRPFFEPRCIAVVGANRAAAGGSAPRSCATCARAASPARWCRCTRAPTTSAACRRIRRSRRFPATSISRSSSCRPRASRPSSTTASPKACKAIVVISAGFGEVGRAGQALQARWSRRSAPPACG